MPMQGVMPAQAGIHGSKNPVLHWGWHRSPPSRERRRGSAAGAICKAEQNHRPDFCPSYGRRKSQPFFIGTIERNVCFARRLSRLAAAGIGHNRRQRAAMAYPRAPLGGGPGAGHAAHPAWITMRPRARALLEGALASGLDILRSLLLRRVLRFLGEAQLPKPGRFFPIEAAWQYRVPAASHAHAFEFRRSVVQPLIGMR